MKSIVFSPLEIILEDDTKIANTKTQSPCKESVPWFSRTGKYAGVLPSWRPLCARIWTRAAHRISWVGWDPWGPWSPTLQFHTGPPKPMSDSSVLPVLEQKLEEQFHCNLWACVGFMKAPDVVLFQWPPWADHGRQPGLSWAPSCLNAAAGDPPLHKRRIAPL